MAVNNEKLKRLRKALQLKLKARAFVEESIVPFLEITTALEDRGIAYSVNGWNILDKTLLPYLHKILNDSNWSCSNANADRPDTIKLLGKLFDRYPSTNALRYVPLLPKMDAPETLNATVDFLGLGNQPVYVHYLRYAPLLKLQLRDLLSANENNLFNFQHGDALVFPKDLSWLIAYSLEEEWYAGRRMDKKSNWEK